MWAGEYGWVTAKFFSPEEVKKCYSEVTAAKRSGGGAGIFPAGAIQPRAGQPEKNDAGPGEKFFDIE
jgi:hypothetical protein